MFVDEVEIEVSGGRGGNGASSFRREKYVAYGGPDGGEGGDGGSVIIEADLSLHTLLDFRYRRKWKAPSGESGAKSNRSGARGEKMVIPVPVGTLLRSSDGKIIADLVRPGQRVLVARGGKGGHGNRHFVNSRQQSPSIYEKGLPGEEKKIKLELKLIADVAIVGFPNAGKSTLISRISAAHPKIADYPFTTLQPHLGVVPVGDGNSFVAVDLPGLIEGAHEGVGQGDRFLRHAERSLLILYLIDVSQTATEKPVDAYLKLRNELKLYSPSLYRKTCIVVGNKTDLTGAEANLKKLSKEIITDEAENRPLEIINISAATGTGTKELVNLLAAEIYKLRKTSDSYNFADANEAPVKYIKADFGKTEIVRENEAFRVKGAKIEKFALKTDFENEEALQRFQRACKRINLDDMLIEKGARYGDTVRVGNYEFIFQE